MSNKIVYNKMNEHKFILFGKAYVSVSPILFWFIKTTLNSLKIHLKMEVASCQLKAKNVGYIIIARPAVVFIGY